MSFDLKFDNMIETGEGKAYMALQAQEFNSFGFENSGKYENDVQNNKILFTKSIENLKQLDEDINEDNFQYLPEKLAALAKVLETKKLAFAQIDYLIRKTPIEETLNFDVTLMVQNIMYIGMMHTKKSCQTDVILMHQNSPLASLGFVAQLLCAHPTVTVVSTLETAVLCHLFVSLCHKVELTNVRLAFVENLPDRGVDVAKLTVHGCVGVVTDRADVDSAVDVFLSSVTGNPWKIRRILVQESICDRVREVLSWKAKVSPSDSNLEFVPTKCSEVFEVKEKKFVYEYCGEEQIDQYIVIETYRTVKELLSLVNTIKPFSVTLWCSDVSQSNEIAYGICPTIIWINDYGAFGGPLKASQALYSVIDNRYGRLPFHLSPSVQLLGNVRDKWLKLSECKKRAILNNIIKKFNSYEQLSNLELGSCIDSNFAEVMQGCICVGTEVANKFVIFDNSYRLIDVLRCLLKGNTVVYVTGDSRTELYQELREEGVPLEAVTRGGKYLAVCNQTEPVLKVVRTSFGTIFAN